MSPDNPEPTPAEWKVLIAVRDHGPLATRDVLEVLAGEGWSTSTIKTLLRRLCEKGALESERVGNSFLYSARRTPMKSLRRAGEALLERAGEAAVGPLLAHLVKRGNLSEGDLEDLRSLIDELSREEGS